MKLNRLEIDLFENVRFVKKPTIFGRVKKVLMERISDLETTHSHASQTPHS